MKHSPGPWKLKRRHSRGPPSVYAADGKSVACFGNARTRTFEQSEADATLAAAAPTMFNALLWAERRLKGDDTDVGRKVLRIVQQALGDADGGEE